MTTDIPFSSSVLVQLVLEAVHGPTCPGGIVEFVCNISSRTFFAWRDPVNITAAATFFKNELPANKSFKDFIVAAHTVTPADFISSTATLMGALFTHNSMVLQCWASGLSANGTVTIAGTKPLTIYKVYRGVGRYFEKGLHYRKH